MNFKIFTIGKIKEKYYKEAIKEYEKRLSSYCKIKLIECKNIDAVKKKLTDKTYIIQLNIDGDELSSEALADKIEDLGISGKSDISFVITHEEIQKNERLSISKMVMETGLYTTILYEQIYRSFRIINNQAYHK